MYRLVGSLTLAGWLTLFAQPGVSWAESQPQAAGCAAALQADGVRWDGLPMERWTWDGEVQDVGAIRGAPVVLCVASGPFLPASNLIGCLLIGDQLVGVRPHVDAYGERVPAGLACGAVIAVEPASDDDLLWVAHNSAVERQVTRLRWNGSAFDVLADYRACWDNLLEPLERSQRPECMGR
jgi:hypothetical protein